VNNEKAFHQIGFLSLFLLAMLLNILGRAIHESGHSMIYQLMGRDPVWGFTKLVQIWDTPPLAPEDWTETSFNGEPGWLKIKSPQESKAEKVIATAAGPIAGLMAAVAGLVLMKKSSNQTIKQIGLVLTLNTSLVAIIYYLRSASNPGGDEFNLAMMLGVPVSLINHLLGLGFAICLVFAIRKLPTWKTGLKWLGVVLLGSAATGIPLAFADQFIIAQVDSGNPWFNPVLGYALPVFLVYLGTLFIVWFWYKFQSRSK